MTSFLGLRKGRGGDSPRRVVLSETDSQLPPFFLSPSPLLAVDRLAQIGNNKTK
jgi:hypothetical protein